MKFTESLSMHLRQVYFGGNWTANNYVSVLENVDWQMAQTRKDSNNSIATLFFHCFYYIHHVKLALQGKPFLAKDELSFEVPTIESNAEWKLKITEALAEVEEICAEIQELDDAILFTSFVDAKYGTYLRNLLGVIEHCHYHLGQITLLKKELSQ